MINSEGDIDNKQRWQWLCNCTHQEETANDYWYSHQLELSYLKNGNDYLDDENEEENEIQSEEEEESEYPLSIGY
jgi:hypothetical protein